MALMFLDIIMEQADFCLLRRNDESVFRPPRLRIQLNSKKLIEV